MEDTTEYGNTLPPRFSSYLRKWWVDNRERLAEWYRIYFHTITVTLVLVINVWLGFSSFLLFFAQWFNVESGPVGFLSMFLDSPNHSLLVYLLNLIYVPLHHNMTLWILLVLNLPLLNWLYSTTTQPIMKGYTTIISWTSRRGRAAAAILSGIPFICSFIAIFAWYVRHYLFDTFAAIKSEKDYLMVHSMESFGYVLMALPVFISIFAVYLIAKEFYRNEDIRKMFYKWEFSLLASQSFTLRGKSCDVIIGWDKKTNKPIVLNEMSRYLHELIVGATGTGKTSTTILIRIVQDLIRIARGRRVGVVVLEPKGDLIRDVQKLCKELGIPDHKIKIVDPTDLVRSIKFNPFVGPLEAAAETFRGVLDALTGNQDEFFKGQQNETASLYTMLGKIAYGNLFSIVHMQQMYSDPRYLANIAEEVRKALDKELSNPSLEPDRKAILERYERIVAYFENDILEYKTFRDKEGNTNPVVYQSGHKYEGQQVVENKKDKFVTGAKKYLNDIVMNAMLSQLMVANDGEEALDIDKFLQEGGVLLVNTALGELEELSLSFGQFFIRQFQSSVFRRPPNESGVKRCPIFFNIDEFPLYINEAFVRLLTLGRSFMVGTLIAIQSLGQLMSVVQGYDRTIMNSARNKTIFGGGEYEDNEKFSNTLGEEPQVEESMNESTTPISMPNQTWGLRNNTQRTLAARFTPTDIKEQEFKHFIVDMVDRDGSVTAPVQAYGKFIQETKFIKRFVNIGKIEFETRNHKPLSILAHKLIHLNLLSTLYTEKKEEIQESINESKPIGETQEHEPIEMLPTSPASQATSPDAVELPMDGGSTSNLTIPGHVDNQESNQETVQIAHTSIQNRLVPVDDEEESPLDQPYAPFESKPIELSPEEEGAYEFYTEPALKVSDGNSQLSNENEERLLVVDDDLNQQSMPDIQHTKGDAMTDTTLPTSMEKSLDTLFNKLDGSTEIKAVHIEAGWGLGDIDSSTSKHVDSKEDDHHASHTANQSTIEESVEGSTNSENNDIDPDIFDLVADNKKGGRSIQQQIANSRISELKGTDIEDD